MEHSSQSQQKINLSSWSSVLVMAGITFAFADFLPYFYESVHVPLFVLITLECVMGVQLILAWKEPALHTNSSAIYAIAAVFCFRIAFHLFPPGSSMWAFQVNSFPSLLCPLVWYGVGVGLMHPQAYTLFQQSAQRDWKLSKPLRLGGGLALLLGSGLLFWLFRSSYITNDGQDWIVRAQTPVWHLYLREPLIIGLHRFVYLIAHALFSSINARTLASTVLALLSVVAGVWSFYWFYLLCKESWKQTEARILAFLLLLSSGGFSILLFGHIEVYPLFVAGLLPTFYVTQRYLNGRSGIGLVAFCFSITFGMHLSAAWLLPAFLLLPFFQTKTPWRELGIFIGFFSLIQFLLWGWLFLVYYQADFVRFIGRLHETFFVGPDKAMFLPGYAIWSGQHISMLFNDYLYLSVSGIILLPLSVIALWRKGIRQPLFWLLLASGYFLYTFLWNPDRGYPEDWDLFSPFALLLCLFNAKSLLQDEKTPSATLYLTTIGIIPYVLYQITFHHTTQFVRVQLFF